MPFSGNKPSVVFFGSGPVAAESLRLLQNHCDIEAVITKPSTLKEMSDIVQNTQIHTAGNKAALDTLMAEKNFRSQLGILIDFGIIVSKKVIDLFEKGIVNSHFSLLPEWRGADPISFAILSGQPKTGVSLMLIDEGMDTGKILTQKSLPIVPNETTASLTQKLISLSDTLLSQYLPRYLAGKTKPRRQSHPDRATYSRKLTKEDGILDFTKPAEVLEREIRAFLEWPKSRTHLAGKDVIITKAHAVPSNFSDQPGDIEVIKDQGRLMINCVSGYLCVDMLKPAGKKEMTVQEFLLGYGNRLTSK